MSYRRNSAGCWGKKPFENQPFANTAAPVRAYKNKQKVNNEKTC